MVKTVLTELKNVSDVVVNTIYFVNLRAFKISLLKQMCLEADTKHDTLVLHAEIQ